MCNYVSVGGGTPARWDPLRQEGVAGGLGAHLASPCLRFARGDPRLERLQLATNARPELAPP